MKENLLILLKSASSERPATREYLKNVLRMSDRHIRNAITELQLDGVRVVTDCTSKNGYWVARSEEEFERYARQEASRIKVLAAKLRAMKAQAPLERTEDMQLALEI